MIGNNNQIINWLLNQEEKIYEIKEYHEKRSLNANSYFYVLQNKLASVIGVSNEELHFELLKQYSSVTLITLPANEDIKGFVKYYEEYKKGTIKNKEVVIYRVYKPSHEMDTKEFSRLLEGLIYECKTMSIETLTPEELLKLEGYEKI